MKPAPVKILDRSALVPSEQTSAQAGPPPREWGARAREAALVVAFFTAVAVFATWPLARHPLGGIYGFGNDNWGGIWIYDWLHKAYWGPEARGFSPDVQFPFGWELPTQVIQPFDRLYALLFGGLGDGLGAYNLQIFLSFVLSGCTMYVLARHVTGSPLAAALAGFIYTFSPFHLAQAMQYGALASIQWIPLFILAFLLVLREPKLRYALLGGLSFALIGATSYYYAWFVLWFAVLVFAAYTIRLAWRRHASGRLGSADVRRFLGLTLSRAAAAGGLALLLAGPFILSSASSVTNGEAAIHPVREAVRYSAHPWMLFIPPHDNPVFGPHVRQFVYARLYENPITEQSLYVGYTAFALALLAFFSFGRLPALGRRERFARWLLTTGVLVGLLIMMGPYLPLDKDYWRLWASHDTTTHLPSIGWLMFELGPVFRFFNRAFVLVSVCLAPLAAIGFARLERTMGRSLWPRVVAVSAAVALVGIEFTNAPPHRWVSADVPAWVRDVQALPEDASIAEYPMAFATSPRSLYYSFWQREHGRKTVDPPDTPAAEIFAASISNIDAPLTGKALHEGGVDYAVVHTRLPPPTFPPYQPEMPSDALAPTAGSRNPWLQVVHRSPDAVVYRVLAAPKARPSPRIVPTTAEFFDAVAVIGRQTTGGLTGTYLFVIEGAGTWLVDARGDTLEVTRGGKTADVVVTTSKPTFQRVLAGQLNPAEGVGTGEIQIRGDLSEALKLQFLFDYLLSTPR